MSILWRRPEPAHLYLSTSEAAQAIALSYPTIISAIRHGKLKAIKLGGRWYIHRDWLLEYRKAH